MEKNGIKKKTKDYEHIHQIHQTIKEHRRKTSKKLREIQRSLQVDGLLLDDEDIVID